MPRHLPLPCPAKNSVVSPLGRRPPWSLGIHSGWAGYAGGNGGEIGYLLNSTNPPGSTLLIVLGNSFDNGWNIGGSVVLDSQKYFSHEFSYDHSFTTFVMGLAVIDHETTTPSQDPLFRVFQHRAANLASHL